MTLAPANLLAVATYWVAHKGVNLGIVGDARHAAGGTSYHLGKDQLAPGAYSARTPRDVVGLSNYASAFDMGMLVGTYSELRAFSSWLVEECRHNAPDTRDIREVIFSPDGHVVWRWDRENGVGSPVHDGEADSSHITHTHVSWYRDSRGRSQLGPFRRYFEAPKAAPHYAATVTTPTNVYNPRTRKWVYNGRNVLKVGTKLVIRGAKYLKGGVVCYPIMAPPLYAGDYVPVAHVKLGARVP